MKKIFFKLILFVPIVLLIMMVNFFVDPAAIFKDGRYESGVASILVSGKNVINVEDYDQRLVQKYMLQAISKPKDIIVLGSSRSMQISHGVFSSDNFLNHSVSGATLEDFMAIMQLYKEKNMMPKRIFLSVDPWIFNKHHGQTRWMVLRSQSNRFARDIYAPMESEKSKYPSKFSQLISPSYFQASLKRLRESFTAKTDLNYQSTDAVEGDVDIVLWDGSRVYDKKMREISIEDTKSKAVRYSASNPMYSLGRFTMLDPQLLESFQKFVTSLRDEHVEIVMFLPAYHPYVYQVLQESEKYQSVFLAESFVRDVARTMNIPIIGSYDPAMCGLGESDFYDGMHIKKESIEGFIKANMPALSGRIQ